MAPRPKTPHPSSMQLNRLTLAFSGRHARLEEHFQTYYFNNTLKQIRIAILAGLIFYALFGILDIIVMPERHHQFWVIRWAIVCPSILGVFLFSFSRHAYRHLQAVISLGTLICGLGIIAMSLLAPGTQNYRYIGGIVQIIFYIFTFARLRFVWATSVIWLLIAIFLGSVTVFETIPRNQVVGYTFHLTLIGVMGMLAGYAFEFHSRRNFFLSRQLETKKRRLNLINRFLEERVTKRTAELNNTNRLLKEKIAESDVIEAALRDSQQRFKNIFVTAAAGIIIANGIENKIVEVNPAAAQMLNDTDSNLKTKALDEVIRPAEPHKRQSLLNSTTQAVECLLITKTGQEIPIITNAQKTEFSGQPHWIISFDNIQKIKEAEAVKREFEIRSNRVQHLQAIGTLAGGIAHDFNNILFGMMGYTELALEDVQPDSVLAKNLEEVLQGGHRAKELIHQILTFSRQDSVEKRPLVLTPLVNEALKLLRASIPTIIDIQTQFAPHLKMVVANPTHIHQVIMNLCTNAAHAIGEKPGYIRVTLDEKLITKSLAGICGTITPGEYIRILVEDNGDGIPGVMIDRIFEPFFTTKSQGQGTGMGLSVALGIVQEHKGGIIVNSESGKGTRFEVLFPASQEDDDVQPPPKVEVPMGSEHILFVDDEKSLGIMIERMLTGLGYQVSVCSQPTEALALFNADPSIYDLVITDLTMPQMSGLQLAKALIDIRPDLPILLCTGYGEQLKQNQCREIGIRELMYKPITKRELADTIRRALSAN